MSCSSWQDDRAALFSCLSWLSGRSSECASMLFLSPAADLARSLPEAPKLWNERATTDSLPRSRDHQEFLRCAFAKNTDLARVSLFHLLKSAVQPTFKWVVRSFRITAVNPAAQIYRETPIRSPSDLPFTKHEQSGNDHILKVKLRHQDMVA